MEELYIDGKIIKITPSPITASNATVKVNILAYNKVNEEGVVLRSIVHVGEPQPMTLLSGTDTEAPIVYNPTELLTNITIPSKFDEDYTWTFINQFPSGYNFNKLKKTGSIDIKYNLATSYAPTMGNDELIYDGWYTFESRAVPDITTPLSMFKNEWAYDTAQGVVYAKIDNPQTAQDFSSIYNIHDQAEKVFAIDTYNGTYTSEDFFVLNHTLTMYSDLLKRKMDDEWFTQFMSIKPKVRSIQTAIELEHLPLAQYILQSLDYSLITQLI
jgi:hypothetical protein